MPSDRQENHSQLRDATRLHDILQRGYAKFKSLEYEEAQQRFEEAAALEPRSAEAHAWLAAVYGRRIEGAWSLMEKVKLLQMLENEVATALDIDPSLPLARRMNGARMLNTPEMLGGDPAAAIDEFRYCIAKGMDEADVWLALAECYIQTEELDQAAAALEEALRREPGNEKAAELLRRLEGGSGSVPNDAH